MSNQIYRNSTEKYLDFKRVRYNFISGSAPPNDGVFAKFADVNTTPVINELSMDLINGELFANHAMKVLVQIVAVWSPVAGTNADMRGLGIALNSNFATPVAQHRIIAMDGLNTCLSVCWCVDLNPGDPVGISMARLGVSTVNAGYIQITQLV